MKSILKYGIISRSKGFAILLFVFFVLANKDLKAQREIQPWESEFDSLCLIQNIFRSELFYLTGTLKVLDFKDEHFFTFNNFYSEYNKNNKIDTVCLLNNKNNAYSQIYIYDEGYLVESYTFRSVLNPLIALNHLIPNKYIIHSTCEYSKNDSLTMIKVHRKYFPESEEDLKKVNPSAIYVDDYIIDEQLLLFFNNKRNIDSFYRKNEMSEVSVKFTYINSYFSNFSSNSKYKVNPDSGFNYIASADYHIDYHSISNEEIRLKQKEIIRKGMGYSPEMLLFFDTLKSNLSVMDIYCYSTIEDKSVQRERGKFHYLGNEKVIKRTQVYYNTLKNHIQYFVEGKFDSRNQTRLSPFDLYFHNHFAEFRYKKGDYFEMNQLMFKNPNSLNKLHKDDDCCYLIGSEKLTINKKSKKEIEFNRIKMNGLNIEEELKILLTIKIIDHKMICYINNKTKAYKSK